MDFLHCKEVIREILSEEEISFFDLENRFKYKTGGFLPFRQFGHPDLLSFLVALADTVKIVPRYNAFYVRLINPLEFQDFIHWQQLNGRPQQSFVHYRSHSYNEWSVDNSSANSQIERPWFQEIYQQCLHGFKNDQNLINEITQRVFTDVCEQLKMQITESQEPSSRNPFDSKRAVNKVLGKQLVKLKIKTIVPPIDKQKIDETIYFLANNSAKERMPEILEEKSKIDTKRVFIDAHNENNKIISDVMLREKDPIPQTVHPVEPQITNNSLTSEEMRPKNWPIPILKAAVDNDSYELEVEESHTEFPEKTTTVVITPKVVLEKQAIKIPPKIPLRSFEKCLKFSTDSLKEIQPVNLTMNEETNNRILTNNETGQLINEEGRKGLFHFGKTCEMGEESKKKHVKFGNDDEQNIFMPSKILDTEFIQLIDSVEHLVYDDPDKYKIVNECFFELGSDPFPGLHKNDPILWTDFPNLCLFGRKIAENDYATTSHIESHRKDKFKILMSEVSSPSRFWFHYEDRAYCLDNMMCELNEYYSKRVKSRELLMPESYHKSGMLCAGKVFNEWTRGIIIDKRGEYIKVFFFDYGTIDFLKENDVKFLLDIFAELPKQAIRGCLSNVKPIGGGRLWDLTVSNVFLEMVTNKVIWSKVVRNREENVLELLLVDTNETVCDPQNIASCLVDKGLAEFHQDCIVKEPQRDILAPYCQLYPTFAMLETTNYPSYSDRLYVLNEKGLDLNLLEETNFLTVDSDLVLNALKKTEVQKMLQLPELERITALMNTFINL